MGEETIDHHADGYRGVVELAKGENYTLAASNSATLTYFATEAYAFDISIPGEGCVGKDIVGADTGHPASSSTLDMPFSTSSNVATSTINPTRVIPAESTNTATPDESDPGLECHMHDDGTEHCV